MERLSEDIRGELAQFGPQAGIAAVVAAWPDAVGPLIARSAWPSRIGRDGTVHVNTTDAIWAFELGHQASAIAARLGVPAVRFVPGPVAEPAAEPATGVRAAPLEPLPEQLELAAAISAAVDDDELRQRVARAVALGLARAASGRTV